MTRSRLSLLGVAGGIIVPLASAITGAILWAPSPEWDQQAWAVAETLVPTALLGALAMVIGVGVVAALGRTGSTLSPGTIVGIGLAGAALVTALCHQAGLILLAGPLLLAASGAAMVGRVILEVRSGRRMGDLTREAVSAMKRACTGIDLVILVVIVSFSITVARFGLTSWTEFVNDFQRYASSAAVWLAAADGSSNFEERHPDSFGSGAISRASYEKPMANGLLVWSSQVTDLPAQRLLTPLIILLLWVTVCAVAHALRTRFGVVAALSVVIALPPSLSVLPISRLLDAQLGQVLANATLATVLAVAARPPEAVSRKEVGFGALTGALVAAAIGMNSTLVISMIPLVGILALWSRAGVTWRYIWSAAAAVVALSLPFATDYLRSARGQTTGEAGFDVEFPSVLAAIGVQPSIDVADSWTIVGWVLVLGPVVLLLALRGRTDRNARWALAAVGVAVLTCASLISVFGAENYSTHKWLASAVPLAVPFLVAFAVSTMSAPALRRTVAVAATVAAAASFMIATSLAYGVSHVVPASMHDLEASPELQDLDVINVALDDQYLDSIAPLAVPTAVVITTGRTYAPGSAPKGDAFLVRSESDEPDVGGEELSAEFRLVERDLTRGPGTILFEGSDPASALLLYAAWAPISESGTPAGRGGAIIALDPSGALIGQDVRVTMYGSSAVTGSDARSGTVTANGIDVARLPALNIGSSVVSFDVPWASIADNGGRLAITLTIMGPRVGEPEGGYMDYTLAQITLEPVAGGG